MPWNANDADRHKKGLNSEQKKKWAKIATGVLKKTKDEGRAVRIANAQAVAKNRLRKRIGGE